MTKCRRSSDAVLSHWLFSAAEWGQTLLHRHKEEPVHWQEHKSHLPRLHRETGLYWWLLTVTDFSAVTSQLMQSCCSLPWLRTRFHFHTLVYCINQITRDGLWKLLFFLTTSVFNYFSMRVSPVFYFLKIVNPSCNPDGTFTFSQ